MKMITIQNKKNTIMIKIIGILPQKKFGAESSPAALAWPRLPDFAPATTCWASRLSRRGKALVLMPWCNGNLRESYGYKDHHVINMCLYTPYNTL